MANVDVYNSIAIATGVSPNWQMRVTNYGHVLCLTEESQQVAQLWQRDRASSINDFRWGVNLRLL